MSFKFLPSRISSFARALTGVHWSVGRLGILRHRCISYPIYRSIVLTEIGEYLIRILLSAAAGVDIRAKLSPSIVGQCLPLPFVLLEPDTPEGLISYSRNILWHIDKLIFPNPLPEANLLNQRCCLWSCYQVYLLPKRRSWPRISKSILQIAMLCLQVGSIVQMLTDMICM